MLPPAWLRHAPGGVEIALYVQPGARRTELAGEHNGAIKLRVLAPPVEGKANAAVIAFVADLCGVAKGRVELVAGELSRHKRLRIDGVDADFVARQFSGIAD